MPNQLWKHAKEGKYSAERHAYVCVGGLQENVWFCLVWDVLILIQEHFQLANTDVQVPIRKLIWNVKS